MAFLGFYFCSDSEVGRTPRSLKGCSVTWTGTISMTCQIFLIFSMVWMRMEIPHNYTDKQNFISTFCNTNTPIILSLNIQSLNSKFNNLETFLLELENNDIFILAVAMQEIWQVPHPEFVKINGYNLLITPRKKGVRAKIKFYTKEESNQNYPPFKTKIMNVILLK